MNVKQAATLRRRKTKSLKPAQRPLLPPPILIDQPASSPYLTEVDCSSYSPTTASPPMFSAFGFDVAPHANCPPPAQSTEQQQHYDMSPRPSTSGSSGSSWLTSAASSPVHSQQQSSTLPAHYPGLHPYSAGSEAIHPPSLSSPTPIFTVSEGRDWRSGAAANAFLEKYSPTDFDPPLPEVPHPPLSPVPFLNGPLKCIEVTVEQQIRCPEQMPSQQVCHSRQQRPLHLQVAEVPAYTASPVAPHSSPFYSEDLVQDIYAPPPYPPPEFSASCQNLMPFAPYDLTHGPGEDQGVVSHPQCPRSLHACQQEGFFSQDLFEERRPPYIGAPQPPLSSSPSLLASNEIHYLPSVEYPPLPFVQDTHVSLPHYFGMSDSFNAPETQWSFPHELPYWNFCNF